MIVLEALLVKACGPLSFILLVQWSHENFQDEKKISFNILATLTITYVWWWFLFRFKHGIRRLNRSVFTNIIINEWSTCTFISNFILVFKMYDNKQHKEFITDHAVPFMDLYLLFKCIKHELWCILYFMYRYSRIMNIPLIKCILLFLYFLVHAVFLVMILDFIYSTCIATTHIFLTDNFFDPYHADLLKDYPAGYGNPNTLELDQNYPAFVKETFHQNRNGKVPRKNLSKEIYKDTKGTYLPYNKYSVLRYIGEDVEFTCSYLYTNSSRFNTTWLRNGKQLGNSNRYFIDTFIKRDESDENGKRFSIRSTLRILAISRLDFGNYECVSTKSKRQNMHLQNTIVMVTETVVISVHHITELQAENKIIYREVGSLVESRFFFYYFSFESDNDVTVEYSINGRPITEECKVYLSQACSLASKLQRIFDSRDINKLSDGNLPILISAYIKDLNIHSAFLKFCLCHTGYGIHRVSFRRHVYLKSKKTIKVLEFQHPTAVIILPRTKVSLSRYFDDDGLYKDIENMINNGTHLDVIQRQIDESLHFISAIEGKVLSIANVVQCFITVISFLFVNMVVKISISSYIRYLIRIPVRRYIYPSIPYQKPPQLEFIKYDIVISYTDSDYTFVADVLVPFLERGCNLKVCLPDRDFNQGRSIFNLYLDAFQTSRKIIVVLSSEYLTDVQCANFQLTSLIFPLVFEKKKRKHDVLLIKYDDASKIPEQLRWNFDVDVLSWITEVQTNLKLKRIRSWYFTGEL